MTLRLPHETEVTIERLGSGGDGVATLDGERLFVPATLPGERWRVRVLQRTGEGLRASPLAALATVARAEPPCPHFGCCGGCLLQHLPETLYAEQKLGRLEGALRQAGLVCPTMALLARSPLASRRRIRLAFERTRGGQVRLGYRQRGGKEIVPVEACPIAAPALQALLAPLAGLLADRALPVDRQGGEATTTLTATGLDLILSGIDPGGLSALERLTAFADVHDLARLSVARRGEAPAPIVTRRAPELALGSWRVALPPTAFVQATPEGEAALQAAVTEWTAGAERIVDLFAGLGTLTMALPAAPARLHLVEAEPAVVEAVRRARGGWGRGQRTVEVRDLERRPLTAAELAPFDTVVLDPPRAGARAQAPEIARSGVERCVYVSCEPATFARDARVLVDGGFVLEAIRPIDQFLFTPHLELAALLRRARRG